MQLARQMWPPGCMRFFLLVNRFWWLKCTCYSTFSAKYDSRPNSVRKCLRHGWPNRWGEDQLYGRGDFRRGWHAPRIGCARWPTLAKFPSRDTKRPLTSWSDLRFHLCRRHGWKWSCPDHFLHVSIETDFDSNNPFKTQYHRINFKITIHKTSDTFQTNKYISKC